MLIENERGCVGGAERGILVPPPPASLSSLSLGEGGGEAVLLKRRKTPLGTGVEVVAVRTMDVLDSDSECETGPTSQSLLALGVATSSSCSQPSISRDASDEGG